MLLNIAYGVAKAGPAMLTRHLARALVSATRVDMIYISSMTADSVEFEANKGHGSPSAMRSIASESRARRSGRCPLATVRLNRGDARRQGASARPKRQPRKDR